MTLRLPPEIEDQLKQVAEVEHRSVQQTVLVAIEEYLSMRETAEILADPSALRGLAEASEPCRVGRPLRDTRSGFHSARFGTQWRVLYRIDESKHAVIVHDIQRRSSARRRR